MKHADFEIVRIESDRIFIVDLDLGSRSVTNDAEWVYSVLTKNFPNKRIIYRDSMKNWGELAVDNREKTSKYKFATSIIFIPYNQHIPDESEITGCPSSAFFDKPKKIINSYPHYVANKLIMNKLLRNYHSWPKYEE